MSEQILLVLCTCPDQHTASRLAHDLVAQQLAACVSISAPVTSVYRWQGKVEQASEVQLYIKTTVETYPALERSLQEQHPYELPEIVAIPLTAGLPDYLEWVRECTSDN